MLIPVASLGNAADVTPSDTTEFAERSAGLWVGGAGDVAVVLWGGQTMTFNAVPAGTWLPFAVRKVLAATNASLIVRCW